jgi:hypothetical protein
MTDSSTLILQYCHDKFRHTDIMMLRANIGVKKGPVTKNSHFFKSNLVYNLPPRPYTCDRDRLSLENRTSIFDTRLWTQLRKQILLMIIQPYHNSSGQSPDSHHEGPVSIPSSPCVICSGQSGAGTSQYPSASAFPLQYHLTNVPYLFIRLSPTPTR